MTALLLAAFLSADPLFSDSFETGGATADGWRKGPAVPGVTYRYDKREASDGERSLALKKTVNRYFPIAGWARAIEAGDGTKIRVSTKVKAEKATKAIVDVQFLNAAGKVTGHEWAAYIGSKDDSDPPATHDWKEYAGDVDVPAGTKQLGIVLQIYGPGEVWFDEVRIDAIDGNGTPSPDSTHATEPQINEVSVGDATVRYILHGESDDEALPLVVVLPGGDGSAEFAPFVGAIQSQGLKSEAVVAQLLSPPHIVWPTRSSRRRAVTMEDAIPAVVEDAADRTKIDRDHVFALAWSSGGPAAYASLLQKNSPLAGALIAMSVFKPDQLPPLTNAKGKRVFILHSPEDKVCPIRMARIAESQLQTAGATVKFQEYAGGHGWHGDVHGTITSALEWLRQ